MSRRDQGSIDKQADGRYLVRLQYINAQGKRTAKKRLVVGYERAKSKLADLRREIERDQSDRRTLRELDTFFRREYVHAAKILDGRKISGYKSDTRIIKGYLDRSLQHFGDVFIDEITFADLLEYKKHLVALPTKWGKERSVTDVNHNLRWLRRMLNVAIEQGWLNANPMKRGKGLIADSYEVERTTVLSEDEEATLLAACVGYREHIRPLVIFAIDTAARKGEILAVRWADVNFDNRSIRVKNKTRNVETTRLVPMPYRLEKVLAELRQNSRFARSFVFNVGVFRNAWKSACKNAGMPDLHFHDLRHTGITRWLERGVSISDAMKASGHTQMKTFMRYVNQHESSMAAFASKLDRAA